MQKVKLITDSASDISVEHEQAYGIHVLPFKLALDGVSYTSRIDFDNDRFYELMEAAKGLPVTSQLTPYELETVFAACWQEQYTDVIYVSINAEGSQTYSNAVLAAQSFFDGHPEAEGRFHIYNIDSGTYTGCYGYAVVEAAKRLAAGEPAEAAVSFIRDWCARSAACFVPYTLKYAGKSGRIPSAAALVGNALGIKPLMFLHDHEIKTVGKVRSEKAVIPAVAGRTAEEMEPGAPYCIVYGSDLEIRDAMAAEMTARVGYPPVDFYQVGAAIATNAGHRLTGVLYRLK